MRPTTSIMVSREVSVVAGVIAVAVSGLIMASPLYGAVFAYLVLGIGLLIIGIQIIAAGISGRKMRMMATKDVSRKMPIIISYGRCKQD